MLKILKNQKGSVLALTALSVVALLAFGALVVNIGYLTVTKTQLQGAVDQGALAGAQNLTPDNTDTSLAQSNAAAYAQKSPGLPTDNIPTPKVTLYGNSATIQVTASRNAPSFFGTLLNYGPSTTVTASATAQVTTATTIPPGAPPFAIQAPTDINWQGTNNMWSQDYKLTRTPSKTDDFTYVDVVFDKSTGYSDYLSMLANGWGKNLNVNDQMYWVAPAEGGVSSVDSFANRLTATGNHDITKAQVGDPNLMLIPLVSSFPTDPGSDWSYSTKGLKIVGFVGMWLESVYKGNKSWDGSTYPNFYATVKFIKVNIPVGGIVVPGAQFFGPYHIQLIQ